MTSVAFVALVALVANIYNSHEASEDYSKTPFTVPQDRPLSSHHWLSGNVLSETLLYETFHLGRGGQDGL